jgi:hypothetical protein
MLALDDTAPSEPIGRIHAPAAILELLPAVAVGIKHQRMQIDPVILAISQLQPSRHLILSDNVPELAYQQALHNSDVGQCERKVQIGVLAGLLPQ